MEQDIRQDPDPSRPENQENHRDNLDSHVMKKGNFDLDLGLQVSTGEGTGAIHSLEEGANTTKALVSKEKKPPMCVRSFNLET